MWAAVVVTTMSNVAGIVVCMAASAGWCSVKKRLKWEELLIMLGRVTCEIAVLLLFPGRWSMSTLLPVCLCVRVSMCLCLVWTWTCIAVVGAHRGCCFSWEVEPLCGTGCMSVATSHVVIAGCAVTFCVSEVTMEYSSIVLRIGYAIGIFLLWLYISKVTLLLEGCVPCGLTCLRDSAPYCVFFETAGNYLRVCFGCFRACFPVQIWFSMLLANFRGQAPPSCTAVDILFSV